MMLCIVACLLAVNAANGIAGESCTLCHPVVLKGVHSALPCASCHGNKAKAIVAAMQAIEREHGGRVPRTREGLEALPGVALRPVEISGDLAAVRLEPRPVPPEAAGFLEFAGRAFRHKRKTLRNNLLPYYGRQVEAWPEARLRAEQIPLEQLLEIHARLTATPPGPRPGSTDSGPTGSSQ